MLKNIYSKILLASIVLLAISFAISFSTISQAAESVGEGNEIEEETIEMCVLDGLEFPKDSEEIDISYHKISELKPKFCKELDQFPNLKKVVMCDTGYTNEDMEALMRMRPEIEFVWMLHFSNKWRVRTDARAFSTYQDKGYVITISDKDAWQFKYCTKMQFLDIGHNTITDMFFLQYMPDLHGLIIHQNYDRVHGGRMRDLSYLKYCPKLTYLEIFESDVSDLSFLQYTPELRDLYATWTPISDITYLMDLPNLERLYIQRTNISNDDYLKLKERYPDVEFLYYGYLSVMDNNWRRSPKSYARARTLRSNTLDPIFYTNSEYEEYERQEELKKQEEMQNQEEH